MNFHKEPKSRIFVLGGWVVGGGGGGGGGEREGGQVAARYEH